jgi:hypothetical protein
MVEVPEFLRSDLVKWIILGLMLGALIVVAVTGYNLWKHDRDSKLIKPCFETYANGNYTNYNSDVICCSICMIGYHTPKSSYIGNACFCDGKQVTDAMVRV